MNAAPTGGGLVVKAYRLLYQSTLGSIAIQRKKKKMLGGGEGRIQGVDVLCIGLTVNVCCWEGWGVEGVRCRHVVHRAHCHGLAGQSFREREERSLMPGRGWGGRSGVQ